MPDHRHLFQEVTCILKLNNYRSTSELWLTSALTNYRHCSTICPSLVSVIFL